MHAELNADFEMHEAVVEFIELTRWLLCGLLGPRHASSAAKISSALSEYVAAGLLLELVAPASLPKLSAAVVALAQALALAKLERAEGGAPPTARVGGPKLAADASVNSILDKLRSALDALKACLGRGAKEVCPAPLHRLP